MTAAIIFFFVCLLIVTGMALLPFLGRPDQEDDK